MSAAFDANDLMLFARVVEAGSFSGAADRLGLPKSTVSRRVATLERRLGERLLQRTTRKIKLTELGEGVLAHARELVSEVDGVLALASNRQLQPTGRLRVSMPGDLANQVLAPTLATFARDHPGVTLDVDLSPRRVDLIGENFDLAIRMGELPDDSSLVARRLAQFTTGLYAAPNYLKGFAALTEPEGLRAMHGLMILSRDSEDKPWAWTDDAGGTRWSGRPNTMTRINSPDVLVRMAVLGAGVTAVSDFYVAPHVLRGELVRVLPDWCLGPVSAWGVFPGRRLMPARTRVFLDAVALALAPCRDPAHGPKK
ncbi:MAG: LysR family transcriptional regulator [Burkholderiales bacterium]|nr:LysR family transcriptional regulator [Burkholderiales bacterium]